MLVKRAVFDRIGFFDERFFLSAEDVDLSLRARKAGFEVVFVPSSVVRHKVSASSEGEGSALNTYYTSRNIPLVLTRDGVYFRTHLWTLMRLFKNLIALIVPGKRKVAKAAIRGIIDFYFGRYGKRY
jgi:GT2 family glycosyltransferase